MNAPLKLAAVFLADPTTEECEVDYGRACPTIPEGEYQATFTHHETATAFSTPKVFLWFRLTEPAEYFGRMIYAAYRVRKLTSKAGKNGGFKVAGHGELFVTVCRILDERGRPDRFSLRPLKYKLLRVRVRTVKRDHRQREIPEARRYSVVDDITGKDTG